MSTREKRLSRLTQRIEAKAPAPTDDVAKRLEDKLLRLAAGEALPRFPREHSERDDSVMRLLGSRYSSWKKEQEQPRDPNREPNIGEDDLEI